MLIAPRKIYFFSDKVKKDFSELAIFRSESGNVFLGRRCGEDVKQLLQISNKRQIPSSLWFWRYINLSNDDITLCSKLKKKRRKTTFQLLRINVSLKLNFLLLSSSKKAVSLYVTVEFFKEQYFLPRVAGVAWSFVACRFCPKRVHLASMLPWFWAITLGILSAKMIFVLSSFVHLHNYMAWRDPCWIPARASHRDERLPCCKYAWPLTGDRSCLKWWSRNQKTCTLNTYMHVTSHRRCIVGPQN